MLAYKSSIKNNKIRIETNLGKDIVSSNLSEIFSFLLQGGSVYKITWDINEFTAPIFSLFTLEQRKALFENGKIEIEGCEITFNQNKSFTIKKDNQYSAFYHLSQYFNSSEPDNIRDVYGYACDLLDALKSIDIKPSKLTSPVAIFDNALSKIPISTWHDVPDEVNKLAWDTTGQAWTEAHQIGYFEQAFDYDLNRSFPSAMSRLLDVRYGKWIHTKEIPSEAIYGFAQGKVHVGSTISPIAFHAIDTKWYNPQGTWDKTLTLQEIQFLKEYDTGNFKIEDGWWWIPKSRVLPLQLALYRIFGQKDKSELLSRLLKRASVGVYGRFIQAFGDSTFGKQFMPVYAAITETEIRLKVARFIYEYRLEKRLIHVSTDGVLIEGSLGIDETGRWGTWRLDSVHPALVVSSGLLFYGDKRPNQWDYKEAILAIQEKPQDREWSKKFERRATLGDNLLYNVPIGQPMRAEKSFSLPYEHDRVFNPQPVCGQDLLDNIYTSEPLDAKKLKMI